MGLRIVDGPAGEVEVDVDPILRNPAGTLQGAMVAALVEAAVEQVLGHRWDAPAFVTDLHVRYLAQNRTGPIRSRTRVLGDGPSGFVVVELVDVTTGVLTTHATARAVAVPSGRLDGRP
jgi:acyl-coenzyme A thioesterase PaaI-like protein